MAFVFQGRYEVEAAAKAFYGTLSERDRRRYVAVEARRLGYGAVTYLAEVFGGSQRTIDRGLQGTGCVAQRPGGGSRAATGWRSKKKSSLKATSNRT